MKYSDEEIKKAHEILNDIELTKSARPEPYGPNAYANELAEKIAKELSNTTFRDHIDFFNAFKKFTKERLNAEIKLLESNYLETKEKASFIDEFIKINLS